ncbi:hypothetical protein SUGI_0118090 [Cryptomeria japonica]|uniref:BURP domain-containing protein 16-like n=1 Tax=Cryptomeria japonica TaxID=3369 RepID=UPI002408A9BF|nr:BURP domain-containing protein 16-like [Cryptomeria japonica]GLJ09910.1 hypothetical protein SUGI_0118090 [Cryptomeria japonica]
MTRSSFEKPSAEVSEVEEHVFFDKKELRESGEIVLPDLSPSNYLISFLPSDLAEMMLPFSSANVSQILNLLNIRSESNLSRNMVGTMEEGEVKRCSTSIEGMVEFVVSVLGSNMDLLSDPSVVESGEQANKRENIIGGKSPVTCHNFAFPYGVSYCHSIKGSEVYDLQLEVEHDKEKVTRNATALCHYTSRKHATVKLSAHQFHA